MGTEDFDDSYSKNVQQASLSIKWIAKKGFARNNNCELQQYEKQLQARNRHNRNKRIILNIIQNQKSFA